MAKTVLTPDISTVRHVLGLIHKALGDKPNDGSIVGGLLNMVNLWADCLPAVMENQEVVDLVFQYCNAILKNWVDVSTNRSVLEQTTSISAF